MPNRGPAEPDQQFEEEFRRHWLAVFRFAVGWTNDWATAEDIAQEAFARLWASRERINWSETTLPWLLTTARHLTTDRFRRLRRLPALAFSAGRSGPADENARVGWLDARQAMAHLTAEQRSALVLTAVLGFDSESAAQILGTTAGGVRAAVSRARQALVSDE
jgi:RNA polymerase sigma-70 factor (ECF subfamily)